LYKKVKKEELRGCGIKAVRNRYRIDSISILAILTNTIRYRYEINASGIEAEPARVSMAERGHDGLGVC
jgi:hypothetical protein